MQHQEILQNDMVAGSRLQESARARPNRIDGDWRHSVQGLLFTGPIISALIWFGLAAAFWAMFD